jgi:L-alanine-DL-glutamate epimerase-like enolase superfamily enzyme
VNVSVRTVRARLRAPLHAAWGSVRERELLVLTLEDGEGRVGYGEAAPLPGYDGVPAEALAGALAECRPVLTASGGREHADILAECAELAVIPQALAAIDVALWDLAGKRAGVPVWQLLGAGSAGPIPVNHTIAAEDRAGAAGAAAEAREAGFGCVKVKVGIGDDAGRVAAVRAAAGPEMAIRLDANGAWSVEEARAALRVLGPAGIELCEEPVHGVGAVHELAAACEPGLAIAIAIDETTGAPGALDRRLCRAACLKLGRCGGITGLIEAARRARRAGYEVYVASALDGPLGIAAALHAAAAIGPDRPCGLATLDLFERPAPGLDVVRGRLSAPPGPGLGDELAGWYR